MSKVGRNDPCPCGSGKKYKNCCMSKDKAEEKQQQAARQVALPRAAGLPEKPPAPPDPQAEASQQFWEELQAQDYEGQIALFHRTLEEEPELIDGELAFEFFNDIYYKMVDRNERDRFEALAEALKARRPEAYASEAGYILDWRITNALAEGRVEAVHPMAEAMAETAEKHIDQFFNLMDQLAYHNQLAALISMTRLAWPHIKDSPQILGLGEFATQAADYLVFDHLSRNAAPDSNDPALLAQIEPYTKLDLALFSDYVARLAGQAQRSWTMADFEFEPPDREDSLYTWDDEEEDFDDEEDSDEEDYDKEGDIDEGRQNLYLLSTEFLGYLYHQEKVPYARGELARSQLYEYILMRHDRELEPAESLRRGPGRKKDKAAPHGPSHPLCPDRRSLDRFLGELLGFFNPQHYKAVATFELIPAWLRFLEARRLIDPQQRRQTLADLRGLDTELLKILKNYPDPALREAMENWRSEADTEL